ncbi:MAG: hypothetical protein ABJB40_13415 [Acidobacteriota bacterium]
MPEVSPRRYMLLNSEETTQTHTSAVEPPAGSASVFRIVCAHIVRYLFASFLALVIFYLSLVITSPPLTLTETQPIDRAISVLESKGFAREAFLLRHVATFRGSDNWLNETQSAENAYAATNFPFEMITLYPDFYRKATDDTERAMVLLHEAQHMQGDDETAAYAYVWQNRERLGWTQLSHGTTETYVTVGLQTRENAPELFTCANKMWNDCTESLTARK